MENIINVLRKYGFSEDFIKELEGYLGIPDIDVIKLDNPENEEEESVDSINIILESIESKNVVYFSD